MTKFLAALIVAVLLLALMAGAALAVNLGWPLIIIVPVLWWLAYRLGNRR